MYTNIYDETYFKIEFIEYHRHWVFMKEIGNKVSMDYYERKLNFTNCNKTNINIDNDTYDTLGID